MDLKEAIQARRSVRDFTDNPVEEALVRQVIDAVVPRKAPEIH